MFCKIQQIEQKTVKENQPYTKDCLTDTVNWLINHCTLIKAHLSIEHQEDIDPREKRNDQSKQFLKESKEMKVG